MKYTRKEFLTLIGKFKKDGKPDYAWLSVYVSKGQLIQSEDGTFDDEIIMNRAFAHKWISMKPPGVRSIPPVTDKPAEFIESDPDAQQVPERIDNRLGMKKSKDTPPQNDEWVDLELEKKRQEVERIQRNNRLLELKEAKIMGEILPVALIEQVFQVHGQSIITAHKAGIESLLVQVAAEARLSGVQLANLRGKMIDSLNAAVEKATAISDQAITAILSDYVNQKEVGEHE